MSATSRKHWGWPLLLATLSIAALLSDSSVFSYPLLVAFWAGVMLERALIRMGLSS